MIQHVYESASKSVLLSRVIVATDNTLIFDAVKKFGGEVLMTSASHNSGTERIAEAINNIDADIIVNIQGDEPFIDALNIDMAIQPLLVKGNNTAISTLANKFKINDDVKDPNKVKVVMDDKGFAVYFSRSVVPYGADEYYKHIGLYVYKRWLLESLGELEPTKLEETEKLEQLRFVVNGYQIQVVVTDIDSVSVDTEEDLEIVRRLAEVRDLR